MEKRPVIEGEEVFFEGVFGLKDVYKLIHDFLSDKQYVPVEKRISESVTKNGKHVEVWFEPFKKYSDYAKSVIRLHVSASDLKDVEVSVDGQKKRLQQGRITVIIDSWLETDYEGRWESKAFAYVIRSLFEKFVFVPFLSGYVSQVRNDTLHVKEQLKAFLNVSTQKV